MNKKQLQKMEYERQCHIRRKYIPMFLHKNFSSLKLSEILKKNERAIKWSKYPALLVPKKHTREWESVAELCLRDGLGAELIAGMNEKDLEKFHVSIYICGVVIVAHIHKMSEVKTSFGSGVYFDKNIIHIKDKQLLISDHALIRLSERAFFGIPKRDRFTDHTVKFRTIQQMIVGDMYGDKIEVFAPYVHQDDPSRTKFWKMGYFVLAEMDKFFYAKTFELPGYCGTPEEFLIKKPWEELTFEETCEVHKTVKQSVAIDNIPSEEKGSISDYICITPAWKKDF